MLLWPKDHVTPQCYYGQKTMWHHNVTVAKGPCDTTMLLWPKDHVTPKCYCGQRTMWHHSVTVAKGPCDTKMLLWPKDHVTPKCYCGQRTMWHHNVTVAKGPCDTTMLLWAKDHVTPQCYFGQRTMWHEVVCRGVEPYVNKMSCYKLMIFNVRTVKISWIPVYVWWQISYVVLRAKWVFSQWFTHQGVCLTNVLTRKKLMLMPCGTD